MSIPFLLFFFFTFTGNTDSLQLPIKNGKIIQNKPGVDKLNKALLIAPTDDFTIRSCLDGRIAVIDKDEWGYIVGVECDSINIIYSIFDSVNVKMNQSIKKGDVIGVKSKSLNDDNYIMFSVFLGGKEVEATDYLVKNKDSQ
ncbi:MAG TPA: M23 family metallopeptidase [Chitinophagaceae bacterium]|nr:M23 family metallopeptidase [Chitinophagaceae bacterium]